MQQGLAWTKVSANATGTSSRGPSASRTQLEGFLLSVLETQPHYIALGELNIALLGRRSPLR